MSLHDEHAYVMSPVPGVRVGGTYELVDILGSGGMGTVWRARHIALGHAVAIKFLQGARVGSDARARFEREARIAARLGEASRHIARVIDFGLWNEKTPYLVMELLHGDTLAARLKRQARMPLSTVAQLTNQLCRALQTAHGAGVVHRDIKPANIFLCETEREDEVILKLLDFGVAKTARESDDDPTTSAGTAVGTPGYMSPEQISCKAVDARSDLWGVAACVYRMVTGRSPFGNGGLAELGLRIMVTDPPLPSAIVPDLPSGFDAWVAKALAKSPEARFQSARDLADALAVLAGMPTDVADVDAVVLTPTPEVASRLRDEPGAQPPFRESRPTIYQGLRDARRSGVRNRPLGRAKLALLAAPFALLVLVLSGRKSSPPTFADATPPPLAIAIGTAPASSAAAPSEVPKAPASMGATSASSPASASTSPSASRSASPSASLAAVVGTEAASVGAPSSRPAVSAGSARSVGNVAGGASTARPRLLPTRSVRTEASALWKKKDEL